MLVDHNLAHEQPNRCECDTECGMDCVNAHELLRQGETKKAVSLA